MGVSAVVRNLRDGELKIRDGATVPIEMTLVLDVGDLNWTETENTNEILDRGRISGGQVRDGDDSPVELTFTTRWVNLIGASVSSGSDDDQLYEMINNLGDNYTSTLGGMKYALEYEFTVIGPDGDGDEVITFAYTYKVSLNPGEGAEFNQIVFNGRDWEIRPTVTRGV